MLSLAVKRFEKVKWEAAGEAGLQRADGRLACGMHTLMGTICALSWQRSSDQSHSNSTLPSETHRKSQNGKVVVVAETVARLCEVSNCSHRVRCDDVLAPATTRREVRLCYTVAWSLA